MQHNIMFSGTITQHENIKFVPFVQEVSKSSWLHSIQQEPKCICLYVHKHQCVYVTLR